MKSVVYKARLIIQNHVAFSFNTLFHFFLFCLCFLWNQSLQPINLCVFSETLMFCPFHLCRLRNAELWFWRIADIRCSSLKVDVSCGDFEMDSTSINSISFCFFIYLALFFLPLSPNDLKWRTELHWHFSKANAWPLKNNLCLKDVHCLGSIGFYLVG